MKGSHPPAPPPSSQCKAVFLRDKCPREGGGVNIFAPMIRRPAGTSLLAIGLVLAGVWAYLLLGVAALPSLDFPGVYVVANMPGASAQTMANTVLAPLERHLGQIPGIDDMYGNAREGSASVSVRFNFSRTADSAARDVQAAINAAAVDLPSGMPSPPQYFKFDTSQIPILFIALTSDGMPQDKLFDLADTILKPAVAQIDGVAQVDVFGGTPHAVRIDLDNRALAAKGLTANDVANALRAANVTSPLGILSNGHTQMTVAANDGLHEPAEFAHLLIAERNGAPVRLSDVATVYSGQQDEYQAAWFDGNRTVGLQITKRPEANAVATVEAIRARLPQLAASMPSDITISPMFDLTQTTKSALHEVKVALLISIAMVALVMLVFLRRLRPTLIAMLSVPLSLAGAFVVMWMLDYTLNTLSLVALVLCIGFVVDDAIVVIENIVRHMEKGMAPLEAALTGVREIGFTVVSITLSLMAVFAPMLFGNNMLIHVAARVLGHLDRRGGDLGDGLAHADSSAVRLPASMSRSRHATGANRAGRCSDLIAACCAGTSARWTGPCITAGSCAGSRCCCWCSPSRWALRW